MPEQKRLNSSRVVVVFFMLRLLLEAKQLRGRKSSKVHSIPNYGIVI